MTTDQHQDMPKHVIGQHPIAGPRQGLTAGIIMPACRSCDGLLRLPDYPQISPEAKQLMKAAYAAEVNAGRPLCYCEDGFE